MKRVIPLMLALLILLTSTCFAAYQPDPARWAWIMSTDAVGVFYDKETIKYTNWGCEVDVWVCCVYPQTNKHTLTNYQMAKNTNRYAILAAITYDDAKGKVIESHNYHNDSAFKTTIIPCSLEEDIIKHLFADK